VDLAMLLWLFLPLPAPKAPAPVRTIPFEGGPGSPPAGFTCARTGSGRPGVWRLVHEPGEGGVSSVLAQTDEDPTGYRFPHCVLDDLVAVDVDLSVRFKPVGGAVDRAAGLVWRYRDPDNYYLVRANALEGNVVLYKVEQGKRTDLDPKGSGLFSYGWRSLPSARSCTCDSMATQWPVRAGPSRASS
jgi:hypothetical protein